MPTKCVASVVNKTTEILLKGIRMAQSTGLSNPCTAKDIPRMLYKKLRPKLALMMDLLCLANAKKAPSFSNEEASSIPSLAGEKWLT